MPVAAISFAIETYCGGGGVGITDQSGGILLTDATVYSGAAALHHAQHQGGWDRVWVRVWWVPLGSRGYCGL